MTYPRGLYNSNEKLIEGSPGMPNKQSRGKLVARANRRASFMPLPDDQIAPLLNAGIRVHDKHRGIYTHV